MPTRSGFRSMSIGKSSQVSRGLTTHTSIINRAGRNASADYVGDSVIQAQEIYGAGFGEVAKLVWFYGEEALFNDRLNIALGRFAPGADFNASPLYCNFMTLTICGHDRALTANQGFEDWPMNEWGGRVRVRPTEQTYIQVGGLSVSALSHGCRALYAGWTQRLGLDAEGDDRRQHPGRGRLRAPDRPRPDARPLQAGFQLGYVELSRQFCRCVNGLPIALTGLAGRPHDGRGQFWATADQMVLRNGPNPNDGLILLATYVHDDSATTGVQQLRLGRPHRSRFLVSASA